MPNFFKRLLLLINYLPKKKTCFYPPQVILEAPFDHSPWREIGEAIRSRQFHLKNPLFRVMIRTSSPRDPSERKVCAALLNYTARLPLEKKIELNNIYGKAINPF